MAESAELKAIRALTDYLDSARGWDIPTHTEYERLRDGALAAAERLAGEREVLANYAKDLEWLVAESNRGSSRESEELRTKHGITPEMMNALTERTE